MKGYKQLMIMLTFIFLSVTMIIEFNHSNAQKIEMKAVLDRYEGDLAVLLLEHWNEEIVIPTKQLPSGSKENTWLIVERKDRNYKVVGIDEETSVKKIESVRELYEKLKH